MTQKLKKKINQREQEKKEKQEKKDKLDGKKEMVLDMAITALQNMRGNGGGKMQEIEKEKVKVDEPMAQQLNVENDDEDTKRIVLNLCDEIEDGNEICFAADKINDDDIALVRECSFGDKAKRMCQEYKRLKMKYNDKLLFIKLIKSCKIIMK